MAVIKVDYITTQEPKLPVFGMERKAIIPRLVHRITHALVPTMSSPGMEFAAAPEMIRELCRKLSPLRGLISRDWGRGVWRTGLRGLIKAEATFFSHSRDGGESRQRIKPVRQELVLALAKGRASTGENSVLAVSFPSWPMVLL